MKSQKTPKFPACKTMILDVFKTSGKKAMTTGGIMSEIEKKYLYSKQAPIKTALKKLIADEIFINSTGTGLNGTVKFNPKKAKDIPAPSKKVQAAKKTTTAKRALKKTVTRYILKKRPVKAATKTSEPKTKKPEPKAKKSDPKSKQPDPKADEPKADELKSDEPESDEAEPDEPKGLMSMEEYKKRIFMSDQLYKDLCAIGAKSWLVKSNKKKCYIGKNNSGNCFLSALCLGFMSIDPKNGKKELNRVMYEGKCPECRTVLKATVKGLLSQTDSGGMYYETGGEGGAVHCKNCEQGYYVLNMCFKSPDIESGKFTNHCTDCLGLGECIGKYTEMHCPAANCDGHYSRYGGGGGCFVPGCENNKWDEEGNFDW